MASIPNIEADIHDHLVNFIEYHPWMIDQQGIEDYLLWAKEMFLIDIFNDQKVFTEDQLNRILSEKAFCDMILSEKYNSQMMLDKKYLSVPYVEQVNPENKLLKSM